jgi:excisionase family DNA binding protein
MERATLTVKETAELLGIGRSTAYRAAKAGQLPVLHIGGRYLIAREALEKMLQVNRGKGDREN